MARNATSRTTGGSAGTTGARRSAETRSAPRRDQREANRDSGGADDEERIDGPGEALIRLLESPLVIDLLAVGASAALAALAEQRFSRRQGHTRQSQRALKAAGQAAAAAIGRRISEEWEEIRNASERAKGGEAA